MKNLPILLVIGILLHACSPKVTTRITSSYNSLVDNAPVTVYGPNDKVPDKPEKLGNISIGDAGFSINCGFDEVLALAKAEARKVGGNALKITKHKEPNVFTSSCHRIKADVLRFSDFSSKADTLAYPEQELGFGHSRNNGQRATNSYYTQTKSNFENSVNLKDYPKFNIAVSAGAGYRINRIADGLSLSERDHLKK